MFLFLNCSSCRVENNETYECKCSLWANYHFFLVFKQLVHIVTTKLQVVNTNYLLSLS